MKQKILDNIITPEYLEKSYREAPVEFKNSIEELYKENPGNQLVKFWYIRLFYTDSTKDKKKNETFLLLVLILLSSVILQFSDILKIFGVQYTQNQYLTANFSFPFIIVAMIYFFINFATKTRDIIVISAVILLTVIYINVLYVLNMTGTRYPASVLIALYDLPLFLWLLIGTVFEDKTLLDYKKWIGYIKINGELMVVGTILSSGFLVVFLLCMVLISSIFRLHFRTDIVAELTWPYFVSAPPILAVYLVLRNRDSLKKFIDNLAKIFNPVMLIFVSIYLALIISSKQNPFEDRNIFIILNIISLIILAISIFTYVEKDMEKLSQVEKVINISSICLTLIIDLIALSATVYRLKSFGFTPNRITVLIANLLILINLAGILYNLIKIQLKKIDQEVLQIWIGKYMIVYLIWTAIVVFIFPAIFGFK
ncbi:MAG: hypothetical protein WC955_11750 [Elusimicrobiota bacterium]